MGRHENSRRTVEECRILDICQFRRVLKQVDYEKSSTGNIEWRDEFGAVQAVLGYWVGKTTVEGLAVLIDPGLTRALGNNVRLMAEYLIRISRTRPHAGGLRHWFRCPIENDGKECGRRVKKLYLPPGETVFGCRCCHRLTYRSCQEHDPRKDKLAESPDAIEVALRSQNIKRAVLGIGALALYAKRVRKAVATP